jgi:branched-chain amino acid transport system ATP-binding protein
MLKLVDVSVSYGPIRALRGVTLHVGPGEIVALLGANGAGKTSLLRAVSRLVPLSSGSIRLQGNDISRLPPHRLAGLGLAHCPEGRRVFPDQTVTENLDLGAFTVQEAAGVRAARDRAFALFPVLADRRRQKAGTLSGGEQQMLAVARALMSSPRLMLLDEPSLGLAPKVMELIFDTIRRVNREDGVTVLLVEQNANEALLHADRAYVIEQGAVTMEGRAGDLRRDPRIIRAYLGP